MTAHSGGKYDPNNDQSKERRERLRPLPSRMRLTRRPSEQLIIAVEKHPRQNVSRKVPDPMI
jgi:hypothetical protein